MSWVRHYRSNILATLSAMDAAGVYLDFGVLAFGTPNWRAARVATSADYMAFEESISAGTSPQTYTAMIVHNSSTIQRLCSKLQHNAAMTIEDVQINEPVSSTLYQK